MSHFDKESLRYDFERTAAGYRLRHKIISKLIMEGYRPDATALDLGCGTGEYTLSLAQMGYRVIAGDVSKGMLRVAKSKIKKHKLADNVQLLRLEATKLPFRDNSFHIITCVALLDWVPNPSKIIDEAHRTLKNNGKLIACVDALWSPYRVYRKMQLIVSRMRRMVEHIFSSRELHLLFTTHGFTIEKFIGDVLLAQVATRLLFDPKDVITAKRVLKITQPLDRHLTNIPLLKSLSAHYIVEAKNVK